MRCHLRELRHAAGLSLTELATQVEVSRQSLSAIESGRSVPSTVLALRLAQALGVAVEELFVLPPQTLPGLSVPGLAGQRVHLGRVDDRWVAFAVERTLGRAADGLVDARGLVVPHRPLRSLEGTALVAGCAPALGVLSERAGSRWLQTGSTAALELLRQGAVHVAGLHLADRDAPELHDELVRGLDVEVVTLLVWREGLIAAPGNPLGLAGAGDLGRQGLRVARRAAGSGAARVLARALAQVGLPAASGPSVRSHADAARAVVLGAADTGVTIEAVAAAHGLPFLPLSEERFELVIPRRHLDHPGVVRLLEVLRSASFAAEVQAMGPCDLALLGDSRVVAA